MTFTRPASVQPQLRLCAGLFTYCALVLGCSTEDGAGTENTVPTAMPTSTAQGGATSPGGTGGAGGATGTASGGAAGNPVTSAGGSGTGGAGGQGTAGSGNAGESGAGGAANTGGAGGNPDPGPQLPKRVLLYSNKGLTGDTAAQMTLLEAKLTEWGFAFDRSSDAASINTDNLKKYGAVGLVNPCFDAFGADGAPQAAALKGFVEAGGGLWGNHCASVTYQNATPPHPYNQLLGGRGGGGFFEGESSCTKVAEHPTTVGLSAAFTYDGNLDDTNYLADDITILVRCKWSGNGMRDVVISWTREPGKGRIFFSNFAKFEVDLKDPVLGPQHLFKGLSWVLRM